MCELKVFCHNHHEYRFLYRDSRWEAWIGPWATPVGSWKPISEDNVPQAVLAAKEKT